MGYSSTQKGYKCYHLHQRSSMSLWTLPSINKSLISPHLYLQRENSIIEDKSIDSLLDLLSIPMSIPVSAPSLPISKPISTHYSTLPSTVNMFEQIPENLPNLVPKIPKNQSSLCLKFQKIPKIILILPLRIWDLAKERCFQGKRQFLLTLYKSKNLTQIWKIR